jgi:16S rRNA processing protein RimM
VTPDPSHTKSSPLAEDRENERVCVAQIGTPHGVRGEVRLAAFTEDPMALSGYGPLETEDGSRVLRIEAMRPAKNLLIARFSGITDRDGAAELTRAKLYIPRARLPEPEAETFYHRDLIGLEAVDSDGASIGTICAVQNFGAGDLIEIVPRAGGATFLLPFTKQFVPVVDIARGRVVIEPPRSEGSPRAREPSPLGAEGGERTKSASRVRGESSAKPVTSSQSRATRTTISHNGRG